MNSEYKVTHKENILIFIDADVVVRHFLDSGVFSTLEKSYNIILIFPPANYNRIPGTPDISSWGYKATRIEIPKRRRDLLYRLFLIDRCKIRSDAEWIKIRNGWMKMIGWKSSIQFTIYSLPILSNLIKYCIWKSLSKNPAHELIKLIDETSPSILIHPSVFQGYFINDLSLIAGKKNLPFILLMNSWDNPSLKSACIGKPNAIVVWGEQTKRHANKFMGISKERIYKFGAAQFEIYREKPTITRKVFLEKNNIESKRTVILYAGSSKGNLEALHLKMLDDAICNNKLPVDARVIYRPHPYGLDQRQASEILRTKYENIVIDLEMINFLNEVADGKNKGFYITPYQYTHNLLSSVDIVISPLSTILIEAGLHGKGILCFIPDVEDKDSFWKDLRKMCHIDELIKCKSLSVVRRYEDFIPEISKLIGDIDNIEKSKNIQSDMSFFVEFPEIKYRKALLNLVDSFSIKIERH